MRMRGKRLSGCQFDAVDAHAVILQFEFVSGFVREGRRSRLIGPLQVHGYETHFDWSRVRHNVRVAAFRKSRTADSGRRCGIDASTRNGDGGVIFRMGMAEALSRREPRSGQSDSVAPSKQENRTEPWQ